MDKKKVLFITPFLIQGGVEHSLINTLRQIDYTCYDVTLFLYKDGTALLSDVPPEVNVIIGIDKTHYYRNLYVALNNVLAKVSESLHFCKTEEMAKTRMQKYIHRRKVEYPKKTFFTDQKFDTVISYCLHIGTEMALEISAAKHILFLHNSMPTYHSEIYESCAGSYDKIIAVSDGVKDVYAAAYPQYSSKLVVLKNYVDAEEIKEKSLAYTIKKPEHAVILCTCGRFSKEKGFDLAVQTAALLQKQDIDFHWFFVGDGYNRHTIETLINANNLQNRITITGFLKNPYPYIASCDVYVQPSYEESYGLTIDEARKLNRLIVSTRTVGGCNVLQDGKYGILTSISAEDISEGIICLLKNKNQANVCFEAYGFEHTKEEKEEFIKFWNNLLSL